MLKYAPAAAVAATICLNAPALGGYATDIGYDALVAELGGDAPTGAGIGVAQVEAFQNGGAMPTIENFPDVTFSFASGDVAESSHANTVGNLIYGPSSIAQGITEVSNFTADGWLAGDYSRVLMTRTGSQTTRPLSTPTATPHNPTPYNPHDTTGVNTPNPIATRLANHSWIGTFPDEEVTVQAMLRSDWLAATDDYHQIAGVGNGRRTNTSPLLSQTYNAIAVGVTEGDHNLSTVTTAYGPYAGGRVRPEIVAPLSATSNATGVVSAAVSLLVETADADPSLSLNRSRINRAGQTIFQAATTEVIKATLMAGANRDAVSDYANGERYTANSANGLDSVYGAGQLDIYNSYHVLTAGQTDSAQDDAVGGGNVGVTGWDYDESFGGDGSNNTADYFFTAVPDLTRFYATLAWNLDVDIDKVLAVSEGIDVANNLNTAGVLYNLDLKLFDVTDGVLLEESVSLNEGTETITAQLTTGHDYRLSVEALGTPFAWDYGLAWRATTAIPSPATALLLAPAMALFRRRARA